MAKVIISVGGGLGNQMFEYAFYLMMKEKYPDMNIKLDIMHTFGFAHNGYEIEKIFGLQAEECSLDEIMMLSDIYPIDGRNYRFFSTIYKIRRVILGKKKSFIQLKDSSVYEKKLFELDSDNSYYILGVFANYKYFSGISQKIRKLYTFPEIDQKNLHWKELIENTDSVSVHIRRGDYVDWGIEVITEDFYYKAIAKIREMVSEECSFYFFTDAPDYVKKTYKCIDNLKIIEGNFKENSFRDMQLMSLCKHNIIANSTFSFWGAYLNKNPDKIVIAPNVPFTGCKELFVCDDWIVI